MRAESFALAIALAVAACTRIVAPSSRDASVDLVDTPIDRASQDSRRDSPPDAVLDAPDVIDASPLPPACSDLAGLHSLALPDDIFTATVTHTVSVAGSACFRYGTPPDAGEPLPEAPGDVFGLHVEERTGIVLSIVPESGASMAVLSVRRACTDAHTEIACMTRAHDNQATLQTVLDTGEYFIVATGMSAAARYRLAVHRFPAPTNANCDDATAITSEVTLPEQRFSGSPPRTDCERAIASELHYAVTVPAGQTAILGVVPRSQPMFAPGFVVRESCDDPCGRFVDGSLGDGLELPNPTSAPRTVFVAVGESDSAWRRDPMRAPQAERFDLVVTMRPTPTNTTIAAATPLVGDARVLDEPIGSGGLAIIGSRSGYGRWRFYRVMLGPDETVVALAQSHGLPSWTPLVRVLDPAVDEPLPAISVAQGDGRGVSFTNQTDSSRDLVIAVGAPANPETTRPGTFDLSIRRLLPPANDRCDEALPLSTDSTFPTIAAISARPSTCSSTSGQYAYFRVEIPPGHMIDSPWSSSASFGECDGTCSGVRAINDGTTIRTAMLTHRVYTNSDFPVQLEDARVTFRTAPRSVVPTANCEEAVAFTPGELLRVDLPRSEWRSRPAHFATIIPPHSWLRVQTPSELSFELRRSCGGRPLWTSRGSSSDSHFDPHWMEYANPTVAPLPVIVSVVSEYPNVNMLITTSIVARAGLGAPIPTDCDEMSTATSMADAYPYYESQRFPLPFPFAYRGEPVAGFASGRSIALTHADGTVAALVAPFENLRLVTMQTFGTAPDRHLTIQGRGHGPYRPYNGDGGTPRPPSMYMTVQLKLFEATGAIEFHYCSFTEYDWTGYPRLEYDGPPTGGGFDTASYLSDGDGTHATVRWRGNTNVGMDFRSIRFLPADE